MTASPIDTAQTSKPLADQQGAGELRGKEQACLRIVKSPARDESWKAGAQDCGGHATDYEPCEKRYVD